MSNDELLILKVDDFNENNYRQPNGWWLEIDGSDYFFPESKCDFDEGEMTIQVPRWLVEKKGLEGYVE